MKAFKKLANLNTPQYPSFLWVGHTGLPVKKAGQAKYISLSSILQ